MRGTVHRGATIGVRARQDKSGEMLHNGVLEAALNPVHATYAVNSGIGRMSAHSGSGNAMMTERTCPQDYPRGEIQARERQ